MKKTKNAEIKTKGDKISFRVNTLEDKKIIEYIDKARNGSAFIKEALKFYIMAIENNIVESYYLKSEEEEWLEAIKGFNMDIPQSNTENHDVEDFIVNINDLDVYRGAQ